jgi:hypothetical protein
VHRIPTCATQPASPSGAFSLHRPPAPPASHSPSDSLGPFGATRRLWTGGHCGMKTILNLASPMFFDTPPAGNMASYRRRRLAGYRDARLCGGLAHRQGLQRLSAGDCRPPPPSTAPAVRQTGGPQSHPQLNPEEQRGAARWSLEGLATAGAERRPWCGGLEVQGCSRRHPKAGLCSKLQQALATLRITHQVQPPLVGPRRQPLLHLKESGSSLR